MILALKADDITRLSLGILDEERKPVVPVQTISCTPEDYLAIIDTFLKSNNLLASELTGIQLSAAGESATSLRSIHAIVNSLAFAFGLPLFRTSTSSGVSILLPEYANDVTITARKKDALGRRAK